MKTASAVAPGFRVTSVTFVRFGPNIVERVCDAAVVFPANVMARRVGQPLRWHRLVPMFVKEIRAPTVPAAAPLCVNLILSSLVVHTPECRVPGRPELLVEGEAGEVVVPIAEEFVAEGEVGDAVVPMEAAEL